MAEYIAASASRSDVLTAYGLCAENDTLIIPAGIETWATPITIGKGLIIRGAGSTSTVITGTGSNAIFFLYLYGGSKNDEIIDISDMGFTYTTNDTGGSAIDVDARYNSFATRLKIHGNKFTKGTRALYLTGRIKGVVWNNTFLNVNGDIIASGDSTTSWSRSILAGTEEAIFIEDNTFTSNASCDREPGYVLYHQDGARTVFRHNTIDKTAYTAGYAYILDSHGNQNYYDGSGDFRGQPITEYYENDIAVYRSNEMAYFRGGSVLFWNNTMTTVTGTPDWIHLTEEESWQTSFFSPLRTVWPAEDQIMNSFFYGNTGNGASVDPTLKNAADPTFIEQDRDFFLHAPQASGGKETYPTRAGADDMTFSSSGANAYYPYTPYTYPHPLRGDSKLVMVFK